MDSNGRFFLLERPDPQEIQDRLWMLYLGADKAKDEMREHLKHQVDALVRREADMLEWQSALDIRKREIDCGEDVVTNLMRELCLKDVMLMDKDAELVRIRRELVDSVRQARDDVLREIEVGLLCVVLFPTGFV